MDLTLSLLNVFFCGGKINESFHLENALNLTYEFLCNNLIKKTFQNFLAKIVIKITHASNLIHFQDEMDH